MSSVALLGTTTAATNESKGLAWMATSAFLYTFSAMIASAVNLLSLLLFTSGAGFELTLAMPGLIAFLVAGGAVSYLMGLPAVVTLALGLNVLGRREANPPHGIGRDWLLFGVGIGLFVVSFPILLLTPLWRIQVGVGLASALILLYAAALPALRRAPRSWWAPGRIAVLLGLAAIVLEAVAAVAQLVSPRGMILSSRLPPIAWGFPASFVVLASAAVLWWTYLSLWKTAKVSVPAI